MVSFSDQSPHEPGTNTLFQCPAILWAGRVLFPSPDMFTSTHIVVTSSCVVMLSDVNAQLAIYCQSLQKARHFMVDFRSYVIWSATEYWYDYTLYGQQKCWIVQGCALPLWAPH